MSQLEDLPLELQEEIFERVPKSVRELSRVSRSVRESSSRGYLKELCCQPPTDKEIQEYLSSYPTIFGTFILDRESSQIYTRVTNERYLTATFVVEVGGRKVTVREDPDLDPINRVVNEHHGEIYDPRLHPLLESHIEDNITFDNFLKSNHKKYKNNSVADNLSKYLLNPQLDLLSTYRILLNRLGCQQRNPNFAKIFILDRLDKIWKDYQTAPNILSLIAIYGYLYLQSSILNVYPSPTVYNIRADYALLLTLDGNVISLPADTQDIITTNGEIQSQIDSMKIEIGPLYLRVREALEKL